MWQKQTSSVAASFAFMTCITGLKSRFYYYEEICNKSEKATFASLFLFGPFMNRFELSGQGIGVISSRDQSRDQLLNSYSHPVAALRSAGTKVRAVVNS